MKILLLLQELTSSKLLSMSDCLILTNWYSASHVDLVRLDQAVNLNVQPKLDLASKHVLASAHGEEVVRAISVDLQVWTLK